MDKIKLDIIGISYSQTQTGAYALILGEAEGKRRLPIIIGGFEAQAIAIELEKMKPTRPLTHDLFKSFSTEFNVNITEVIIYKFINGIFYSKLVCESPEKITEIDSRTSDAVAIAVRFNCPIYTFENIMEATGVILDETAEAEEKEKSTGKAEKTETKEKDKEKEKEKPGEFASYTAKELDEMLMTAIDEEHYEKASRIRDEINKRKERKKKK
ncbi:MAG: bifunctional nuclease family protein [Bacteroidales bacterium]|nr:bifunctional nuclease family protein [Bacteroidales bacterium]